MKLLREMEGAIFTIPPMRLDNYWETAKKKCSIILVSLNVIM